MNLQERVAFFRREGYFGNHIATIFKLDGHAIEECRDAFALEGYQVEIESKGKYQTLYISDQPTKEKAKRDKLKSVFWPPTN